ALTNGAADRMQFPHSRWNEVREADLISCGYATLTKSDQAGVDLFAKRKGRCLFVHLQGHPEYGARTLLKEYRRDVRRFLNHERETYPPMPEGYFDATAAKLLANFRENALLDPKAELINTFPDPDAAGRLQKTWHTPALCLYSNWLNFVRSRKAELPRSVAFHHAIHYPAPRKRSGVSSVQSFDLPYSSAK
ncbi:MAG: homoserine O-acetyltransferase/O-succinyltransferase family protein, partial [Terriglobia bacterium]